MNLKVSVIMPVYNAEKYLAKSIDSILNQTLKEFELILVNDGSKDNSKCICDEYKLKDDRIKVIHKINEGACIARNTGLENAIGEYIQFIDADDYIENNMLEEQYNLAKETQAEVVMCGMKYDIHQKNGQIIYEESSYKDMILKSQDDIKPIFMDLFDNLLFNYTHNKLYKASFLKDNNLRFIDWLPIDQDTNFNIDVFRQLNKLTISTKSYYHYIKTFEETIVSRYHPNKFEVRTFRYNRLKALLKDWDIYDINNSITISSIYIHQVIECIEGYSHNKCKLNFRDKLKNINKILNKHEVIESMKISSCKSIYTKIVSNVMKLNMSMGVYFLVLIKKFLK